MLNIYTSRCYIPLLNSSMRSVALCARVVFFFTVNAFDRNNGMSNVVENISDKYATVGWVGENVKYVFFGPVGNVIIINCSVCVFCMELRVDLCEMFCVYAKWFNQNLIVLIGWRFVAQWKHTNYGFHSRWVLPRFIVFCIFYWSVWRLLLCFTDNFDDGDFSL